jgi:hypothetical protein
MPITWDDEKPDFSNVVGRSASTAPSPGIVWDDEKPKIKWDDVVSHSSSTASSAGPDESWKLKGGSPAIADNAADLDYARSPQAHGVVPSTDLMGEPMYQFKEAMEGIKDPIRDILGAVGKTYESEIGGPLKMGARKFSQAANILGTDAEQNMGNKAYGAPFHAVGDVLDVVAGDQAGGEVPEKIYSHFNQQGGITPVEGKNVPYGQPPPKFFRKTFDSPYVKGALDVAGGLVNADNFIFLAAEPAMAPGTLLRIASRLGYSGAILDSIPDTYRAYRQAADNGDWREARRLWTSGALQAVFSCVLMSDATASMWERAQAGKPLTKADIEHFGERMRGVTQETLKKAGKPPETLVDSEPSATPTEPSGEPAQPPVTPQEPVQSAAPSPEGSGSAEAEPAKPESPPAGTPIQTEAGPVPAAGMSQDIVPGVDGESVQRNNQATPELHEAVSKALVEDLPTALETLKDLYGIKIPINLDVGGEVSVTRPGKGRKSWDITLADDRADAPSLLHEFYHVLDGEGEMPKGFPRDADGDYVFDNNAIAQDFLTRHNLETQPLDELPPPAVKTLTRGFREFFDAGKATVGKPFELMYKMLGQRRQADEAYFNVTQQKIRSYMEKFRNENPQLDPLVEWTDLAQQGKYEQIPDENAREVFKMYRGMYDDMYKNLRRWDKDLEYVPGYLRRMWSELPQGMERLRQAAGVDPNSDTPLGGYRGWTKDRFFKYMKDGVDQGGKPMTTNPADLFGMYYSDAMRYVTGKKMIASALENGSARFVANGEERPAGWLKLDDRLTGNPQGYYVFDPLLGNLLKNYLSADHIGNSTLGRAYLTTKNFTTQLELGVSAFHYGFIANEASASALGSALVRGWNPLMSYLAREALGARGAEVNAASTLGEIKKAAKDFGVALPGEASPLLSTGAMSMAQLGGMLRDYGEVSSKGLLPATDGVAEWLKSPRGKKLTSSLRRLGFDSAQEALQMYYDSAGQLSQAADYRTNSLHSWRDSVQKNDLMGSVLKAYPGMVDMIAKPLFEDFIPSVKLGFVMNDYANRLATYQYELATGKVTKDALFRQSQRAANNRFGEMKFDTLFWNNDVARGLQGFFRSATWKIGSLRGYSDAVVSQMKILLGKYENGEQSLRFRVSPDMAWAMSSFITHATQGYILTKLYTGQEPKDFTDYMFPPVGGMDSSGHPVRLAPPGYMRDLLHMTHDPAGYLRSSLASPIGRTAAALSAGKNYWGESVSLSDPMSVAREALPIPFSFQSMQRIADDDAPLSAAALSFIGYGKVAQSAPGVHTPDERLIEEAANTGDRPSYETEKFGSRQVISRAMRDARYGTPNEKMTAEHRIDAQEDVSQASIDLAKKNMERDPYEVKLGQVPWDRLGDLADGLSDGGVRKYGQAILDRYRRSEKRGNKGVIINKLPELEEKMDKLEQRLSRLQ